MLRLHPEDREVIATGMQDSLVRMGQIVKIVTWDPANPGGGGGLASTSPVFNRLFGELQKLLHEIESEILKGWHIQPPVPPSA